MKIKLVTVDLEISPRAKRRALAVGIPLLVLGAAAIAHANVKNVFKAGDVVSSQAINENFADLDGRVAKVETKTSSGVLGGTGSLNQVARFTSASSLGAGTLHDDGKNVGIGTANPAYRLDINTGALANGLHLTSDGTDTGLYLIAAPGGPGAQISGNAAYNGTSWIAKGAVAGIFGLLQPQGHFVYAANTGLTPGSPFNPATLFTITTAGNVGIGTASPASALDVNGIIHARAPQNDALIIDAATPSGAGLISVNMSGTPNWRMGSSGNGGVNDFAIFSYNNMGGFTGTRFHITRANGNVGIGTENPDNLLTVNGTADKPGGGSWGTFSDARLKDVAGPFDRGLDALMKLEPVRYRYKRENALGIKDQAEHVGFVAQSVRKAVPEAVSENDRGYLLVDNDPILWTMVNGIKEQQRTIERQRSTITDLEKRLASQEERLRRIESVLGK